MLPEQQKANKSYLVPAALNQHKWFLHFIFQPCVKGDLEEGGRPDVKEILLNP